MNEEKQSEATDLLKTLMQDTSSAAKKKKVLDLVHPLSKELAIIGDEELRDIISLVLTHADLFWDAGVDNIEGYPADEYGLGGLVLHTKRVVRAAIIMSRSALLSSEEKDALYAACILHAVAKPLVAAENRDDAIFDHHYMISFDQWFTAALEEEVASDRIDSKALEVNEPTLGLVVRLIHCCEGKLSPIHEMVPKEPLEMLMAAANLTAKELPFIVDGVSVNEDRWISEVF